MADGLEGVVATATRLSEVDGDGGRLTLAGYAVEDLAPNATFEEVAYLFLHGRLPDAEEHTRFARDLGRRRTLTPAVTRVLQEAAAAQTPPMDALRMAAPLLSLGRDEQPLEDAMNAIASFPTIVGSYWRLRSGEPPVAVRADLTHAAHYLHQLSGLEPSAERARALETYLNTVCDHGLNASTFTARVTASTGADCAAALSSAVGALSGPLHGGAPAYVKPMLDEVTAMGDPEKWVREALDARKRIMGFGHRVYRAEDPRSRILKRTARELGSPQIEIAERLEEVALAELERRHPERPLRTNVEYYSALVLDVAEIPPPLAPAMFACSRVAGWSAHILEQKRTGRLFRPSARYVGPGERSLSQLS